MRKLGLTLLIALTALSAQASLAASSTIVISQVYGGGGNSGAPYRNDFIELHNLSTSPATLNNWCVQYAAAGGNFNATTTLGASVVIPAGGYYLVQEAVGASTTAPLLPAPDATGSIAMSATAGKVALTNDCNALGANVAANGPSVVDYVGYGTATTYEGAGPTPAPANPTAVLRAGGGCTDSDDNSTDFATASPAPRNSATAPAICGVVNAPVVPSCPANVALTPGAADSRLLSASDADGLVASAQITSASPPAISLSGLSPSAATGAAASVTINFSSALPVGSYPVTVRFGNADASPQTGSCVITVAVAPPAGAVRIRDIQGATHLSPLSNLTVAAPGIVTAKTNNGFYIQDPLPDADPATSEGIFVFTSSAPPPLSVGDAVTVTGTVQEFRVSGADGLPNLTVTEIVSPVAVVESSGNALPAAIVIGSGGRIPPTKVIDDDANGNVENGGTFDVATDGIDFYESLEGMRVQVNNVVVTGPTTSAGEVPVIGDSGANASVRTPRGGIVIRADDNNPERIFLDNQIVPTAALDVGDTAPVASGVLSYSSGNFKLVLTSTPAFSHNGLQPEVTDIAGAQQLTIASFNVENLKPADSAAKFTALATQIVTNLRSPDVVGLMEMQDNNGATNNGTVAADQTFAALIAAIANNGGPNYQYRQINPADGQDGGEPGGNIRVGFLFNPLRVSFIDRPGGTATAATTVVNGAYGPELSASPGRIDPTNPAFSSSRKPLVGEFLFNGRKLFLIANHFNSKLGDEPLFGKNQPASRPSEIQRGLQATAVATFVQSLRTADPLAKIVVLGDLNDFQFSNTLVTLKNAGLIDLIETLPESERYTYVFDGNSQAIDHILISDALSSLALPQYDVVHVNSEFANQTSDHEPEIVRLTLPALDLTGSFTLTRSGLVLNRVTNTYNGTVTLKNVSGSSAPGPLRLRFEGLTAGVTLVNVSGTGSDGVPYIDLLDPSVAPGAQVQVTVQFSNPSRVAVAYASRILSGQF